MHTEKKTTKLFAFARKKAIGAEHRWASCRENGQLVEPSTGQFTINTSGQKKFNYSWPQNASEVQLKALKTCHNFRR